MHRLAGLFAASPSSADRHLARICARQEPHRVCRRFDEERARRHRRRLYRQDGHQNGRELCREFGARQADRAGRAGECLASADTDWMDYATAKKNINEPTRVNLLGNSIVLIAPKDSKIDNVAIAPGFDLAKLAGDGKIATGDVKAVPVGKYAKAALESSAHGRRQSRNSRWRRACAPHLPWWRAAKPCSVSSIRPMPRSSQASRSSAPSRRIPTAIIYPVAATATETGGCRLSRVPALVGRQGNLREIWLQILVSPTT